MRYLRKPSTPALLASAILLVCLLIAGCSRQPAPAVAPGPTQPSVASNAPTVKVTVSARGSGGDAALARASATATKELEQVLTRYLTVAFAPSAAVEPDGDLARLFDPQVRDRLAGDLTALSLGAGGANASAVRTEPANATVSLLARGDKPLAATVLISMDGTAVSRGQAVQISLRSTFQMLRGGGGWSIVAYDSQAKVPA